jgi:glucose uptake protein
MFFYKYVAASMFPDFNVPEAGKLSPYCCGVLLCILLSNIFVQHAADAEAIRWYAVNYSDYFKGGLSNHITGIWVVLSGA